MPQVKRKAFGAAASAADDLVASTVFYNRRAIKAKGTLDMFLKLAQDDPEYRETKVGFQLRHICLPKKNTGFGALVSQTV